jgi:hypothetical protein
MSLDCFEEDENTRAVDIVTWLLKPGIIAEANMIVCQATGFGCHSFIIRGITLTVESPYPQQQTVKAQLPQIRVREPLN